MASEIVLNLDLPHSSRLLPHPLSSQIAAYNGDLLSNQAISIQCGSAVVLILRLLFQVLHTSHNTSLGISSRPQLLKQLFCPLLGHPAKFMLPVSA